MDMPRRSWLENSRRVYSQARQNLGPFMSKQQREREREPFYNQPITAPSAFIHYYIIIGLDINTMAALENNATLSDGGGRRIPSPPAAAASPAVGNQNDGLEYVVVVVVICLFEIVLNEDAWSPGFHKYFHFRRSPNMPIPRWIDVKHCSTIVNKGGANGRSNARHSVVNFPAYVTRTANPPSSLLSDPFSPFPSATLHIVRSNSAGPIILWPQFYSYIVAITFNDDARRAVDLPRPSVRPSYFHPVRLSSARFQMEAGE